jgi:hypothetical protein
MAEAPSRTDARKALERFRDEFDAKYPKAVAKLDKDWDALTAFYDFPAEHWRHLRTTDESVKGPVCDFGSTRPFSRASGLVAGLREGCRSSARTPATPATDGAGGQEGRQERCVGVRDRRRWAA